jgi:EAL and modified HD-GYP domain-containing signal transduction protein
MSEQLQAFLGRQPIIDRDGRLMGYELLYRTSVDEDRARFQDEDSASLGVLSTLLHDLGHAQVLAGRTAFVNIGSGALHQTGALSLLTPRLTVLELSPSVILDDSTIQRLRALRQDGFGISVTAVPPMDSLAPWLEIATHLKVDLSRVDDSLLDAFVVNLRFGPHTLIAEKVETPAQARRSIELGFHGLQGWHVGRPEVMGSVKLGVRHAVLARILEQLAADASLEAIEATFKHDIALCWRLLRYTAASNFGLLIEVESLRHALEMVGNRRLTRWIQLLQATVEEPSPAAERLIAVAVMRGRMLEMVGADYFNGTDCDNLFLVGAFSVLPSMLMQTMAESIRTVALPEAVADALTTREGRFGHLLELVEALEADDSDRIDALCAELSISSRALVRARTTASAALQEAALV